MARLQRDLRVPRIPRPQRELHVVVGDNYAGNLGPQRKLRLKPFQTFVRKGCSGRRIGLSRYALRGALRRVGVGGIRTLNGTYGATPFVMNEAVDVRTALRSYTPGQRARCFSRIGRDYRGRQGRRPRGWDRNPYAIPADQLRHAL